MPATRRAMTRQTTPGALPLQEQTRQRAYELYVRRGNQSGSEFDDWLQAEAEILEHTTHSPQTEFRSNLRTDRHWRKIRNLAEPIRAAGAFPLP